MSYKTVKLQLPYELSFLSVFWITSKSNLKKSGCCEISLQQIWENKDKTQRGIMAFETNLFYGKHVFIYGTRSSHITGGPQNDQIRYSRTDKECKENDPSSTAAKEPCVFSEIKSITLDLCGFTFIYAEIKQLYSK